MTLTPSLKAMVLEALPEIRAYAVIVRVIIEPSRELVIDVELCDRRGYRRLAWLRRAGRNYRINGSPTEMVVTRQARAEGAAQAAARSRATGEMTLPPLGRIDPPAPLSGSASNDGEAVDESSFLLGEAPPPPSPGAQPEGSPYYGAPVYSGYPSAPSPAEQALTRQLSGPVFAQGSSGGAAFCLG